MSETSYPNHTALEAGATLLADRDHSSSSKARQRRRTGSVVFHVVTLAIVVVILYPGVWRRSSQR